MTLSLKIEILKVFSLEFNLSSEKGFKLKKDKTDEKAADTKLIDAKPTSASK